MDFGTGYSKINSKQPGGGNKCTGFFFCFFSSGGVLDNNYVERTDDSQVPCKHLR